MSLAGALAAVVVAASAAQVELRRSHEIPTGTIVGVSEAGVLLSPTEMGPPDGVQPLPTLIISWDRIRTVRGEFADVAAPLLPMAEQAWRARTRLERGDALAAEPLFEALFDQYRLSGHLRSATGAVIAEGLLRCRLRRGAHIAAVEPWLALHEAPDSPQAHGADWARLADLPPVVDQATGLAPALPPMWLAWPAVEAFGRGAPIGPSQQTSEIITQRGEAMAALYLHAARVEAGIQTAFPQIRSSDPGVQLVLAIVQARSGDPEQRLRARQRLEERMRPRSAAASPPPAWMEVWCRAAIGRSLLKEESTELRQLGILELLHLPARFPTSHPYLTGLALAEASIALRDLGDTRSAEILAGELADKFPTHPAHDWERLRQRAGVPRTGIAPASPGPAGISEVPAPPKRR